MTVGSRLDIHVKSGELESGNRSSSGRAGANPNFVWLYPTHILRCCSPMQASFWADNDDERNASSGVLQGGKLCRAMGRSKKSEAVKFLLGRQVGEDLSPQVHACVGDAFFPPSRRAEL